MKVKLTRKHKLAIMLQTAAEWHGDTGDGPVAMLSLSSTRKVHTEEHRRRLLVEIREDMICSAKSGSPGDIIDIKKLADLWLEVYRCKIGHAWLSDQENMRFNEELYKAGML